jgi:hypothetical protein
MVAQLVVVVAVAVVLLLLLWCVCVHIILYTLLHFPLYNVL